MRLALVALLLPAPALAQQVIQPGDFAALAEGHTLHFSRDGAPFGAEQYFPGRRSLWRYAGGECETGTWWDEGDLVCFDYGDGFPPQCWRFRRSGGEITATLVEQGVESSAPLRLTRRDATPLDCPGPDVGS